MKAHPKEPAATAADIERANAFYHVRPEDPADCGLRASAIELAEEFAAIRGEAALASTPAQPANDYERGVLAEHKSHVDFENELYATLVDPVAEGPIKEAEMRKQLLESARWYRQHVYDLENQLNILHQKPAAPPQRDAGEKVRELVAKRVAECRETAERWAQDSRQTRIQRAITKQYSEQLHALANLLEAALLVQKGEPMPEFAPASPSPFKHWWKKRFPNGFEVDASYLREAFDAGVAAAPRAADLEPAIRAFLWKQHGHDGIYGDDGEMQCGECGCDYKRDPLEKCVKKSATAALQDALTPRATGGQRESALQKVLEELRSWAKRSDGAYARLGSVDAHITAFVVRACISKFELALAAAEPQVEEGGKT